MCVCVSLDCGNIMDVSTEHTEHQTILETKNPLVERKETKTVIVVVVAVAVVAVHVQHDRVFECSFRVQQE